ncbi:hypothetical protein [Dulcicalothrix desertica]|uniref:hypothetical protein n=1 Tax=Dulcicalothrix desertica TaxID=32056 RepID=UPI000F8E25A7|nr:hypothetical protein [Dulcicalothrix desertica]
MPNFFHNRRLPWYSSVFFDALLVELYFYLGANSKNHMGALACCGERNLELKTCLIQIINGLTV